MTSSKGVKARETRQGGQGKRVKARGLKSEKNLSIFKSFILFSKTILRYLKKLKILWYIKASGKENGKDLPDFEDVRGVKKNFQ